MTKDIFKKLKSNYPKFSFFSIEERKNIIKEIIEFNKGYYVIKSKFRKPHLNRNQLIIEELSKGTTLHKTSILFGLTKERIRQIRLRFIRRFIWHKEKEND